MSTNKARIDVIWGIAPDYVRSNGSVDALIETCKASAPGDNVQGRLPHNLSGIFVQQFNASDACIQTLLANACEKLGNASDLLQSASLRCVMSAFRAHEQGQGRPFPVDDDEVAHAEKLWRFVHTERPEFKDDVGFEVLETITNKIVTRLVRVNWSARLRTQICLFLFQALSDTSGTKS